MRVLAPALLLIVLADGTLASNGQCKAGEDSCSGRRKVKIRKCSPPPGNELAPARRLSVREAVKECRRLSGCHAVTTEVSDFEQEAEYDWHFKTTSEPCVVSPSARTVEIPAQAQTDATTWLGPLPLEDLRSLGLQVVHEDPPVIQMENFLSDLEVEHIKSLAEPRFVKSTVGMTYEAGNSRTSETAWLNWQEEKQF